LWKEVDQKKALRKKQQDASTSAFNMAVGLFDDQNTKKKREAGKKLQELQPN
jgi:hypothetical protein